MVTVYLVCFFVGIFFVVITALISGVFSGGEASTAADGVDCGHDVDVGGHDLDVGGHDVDVCSHGVDVGGHDVDVSGPDGDFDTDVSGHEMAIMDASPTLSPLSPTVLAVFVTSFGGFGYLALIAFGSDKPYVHVPIAALSGFVLGLGTFILFNKIFDAIAATSHYSRSQLVGLTAEVLVTIPEDGVGEISFVAGSAQESNSARSDEGKTHPAHSTVIITRVAGGTAYVKEAAEEKFARLTRRKNRRQRGKEQKD